MNKTWLEVIAEHSSCTRCHEEGLLHPEARPLFGKFRGERTDLLFVLEAPNYEDTHDPNKGYLTVEPNTDPSVAFFYKLYTEILAEPIENLVLTNAVLCLPAGTGGRHPVGMKQMRACSPNLREQVRTLDPMIVVPMGMKALVATNAVDEHRLRTMADAVARPTPWFGRVLFPVFHTGLLARNGPSGRKADQQREDWTRLRDVLVRLRRIKPT